MIDAFTVKGSDGLTRSLSEHYDSQKDVKQDPYGAWLAIQNQSTRIADLQAKLAEVEAERDEWKGVYQQADRHHMEAERSTKTAEAAIPRAYQMGLDAAATTASCECCCGPITLEAKILAIQPPADLVEQCKKEAALQTLADLGQEFDHE